MLHSFHFFFHLKFLNGGGKEAGRVKGGFILGGILLYYFINVMLKTLYISGFIVVYVIYFTQRSYYYVMCFSLFLKSYIFGCKKCIFSHSFWPRWLKQTSFYREFNYLHSKVFRFSIFYLFPVKRKQNKQTIAKNCTKTKKMGKTIF